MTSTTQVDLRVRSDRLKIFANYGGTGRVENSKHLFLSAGNSMNLHWSKLVHINSPLQCPIHGVLFCCSLCMFLMPEMFTILYNLKIKIDNMENVNTVFWKVETFRIITGQVGSLFCLWSASQVRTGRRNLAGRVNKIWENVPADITELENTRTEADKETLLCCY